MVQPHPDTGDERVRMQITITRDTLRRIRRLAAERGCTAPDLMRLSIEQLLKSLEASLSP